MQGRWRKKPLSLTLGSKEMLSPPVLPQSPRIRQIYLWWSHLPIALLPSHLHHSLHRWISLSSWPAIASWPVTSIRSISKTTCASITVQDTISWTPTLRSRPWSCLRAMVLQQLPPRNPQKNREQPSELYTDCGPYWTSLCSNKSDSTQCIRFFQFSFTLCFPYFSLDPWSGSP